LKFPVVHRFPSGFHLHAWDQHFAWKGTKMLDKFYLNICWKINVNFTSISRAWSSIIVSWFLFKISKLLLRSSKHLQSSAASWRSKLFVIYLLVHRQTVDEIIMSQFYIQFLKFIKIVIWENSSSTNSQLILFLSLKGSFHFDSGYVG